MKANTSLLARPSRSPPADRFDARRSACAPSSFCGDAFRLPCCVWPLPRLFVLFRGCPLGRLGAGPSRSCSRAPFASPSFVRTRQTVEDSVPTLTGFVPLPVTPAAVIAWIMSRQLMPRCSAASNHHMCRTTRRESFLHPPPGRWKSSAIALSPASSSLLLIMSNPHHTAERYELRPASAKFGKILP